MDIEYLLVLQDFRNTYGTFITPIMNIISDFAIKYMLAIIFLIYWCVDKKAGIALMFPTAFGSLINECLKMTACIYRPWVRDSRIIADAKAIKTATGYSFPSGHSAGAAAEYGSAALMLKKKNKILAGFSLLMIALTMFSRNYLGVHTPQDVLAGASVGVISLFMSLKILPLILNDEKWRFRFIWITLIISIAVILYISLKTYPLAYDASGNLLTDPYEMQSDSFQIIGLLNGAVIGIYIEEKYINFSEKGTKKMLIIRALIGLGLILLVREGITPALEMLDEHWGVFAGSFLLSFMVMAAYPFLFKKFEKTKAIVQG
ncbi:MAG: phosphatase PAP2 family protein [Lachnospiraceae bacterium]|nr:phosphatase PAP2 family protein [Lachnospiraceae bacterium]